MQNGKFGKYCDHCEKNIYDLTEKSDAELVDFFKNKKDDVCGRVFASQLNRPLIVPLTKPSWQWLFPLAIGAVAINPAQAQNFKPVVHHHKDSAVSSRTDSLELKPSMLKQVLTGKVIDSLTGRPLTGVKIRQEDFQNVLAVTDGSGIFSLSLINVNTKVPFIFELYGQTVIRSLVKDNIVVKMKTSRTIMLGSVVAGTSMNRPMYIIYSGNRKCWMDPVRLNSLSPDWIDKIEVLDGEKAKAIYGNNAADGVILIGIKKVFASHFDFSKSK